MKQRKPAWLRKLKLGEVSLVGRGANQHAMIGLWKSADGVPPAKEDRHMKTELEKMADDLAAAKADIAKRDVSIVALEKALADKAAELAVREKDLAAARVELDREVAKHADPEEAILKGMSEPARKAYLAQQEQTKRLQKRLDEADEARAIEKLATEFEKDFPALPAKGSEIAPVLKKVLAAVDEDGAKMIRALFKAGSDALADLQKLSGYAGGETRFGKTSTEAEVEKRAREKAERDNVTFETAYAAILKAEPNLYVKIKDEQAATR